MKDDKELIPCAGCGKLNEERSRMTMIIAGVTTSLCNGHRSYRSTYPKSPCLLKVLANEAKRPTCVVCGERTGEPFRDDYYSSERAPMIFGVCEACSALMNHGKTEAAAKAEEKKQMESEILRQLARAATESCGSLERFPTVFCGSAAMDYIRAVIERTRARAFADGFRKGSSILLRLAKGEITEATCEGEMPKVKLELDAAEAKENSAKELLLSGVSRAKS